MESWCRVQPSPQNMDVISFCLAIAFSLILIVVKIFSLYTSNPKSKSLPPSPPSLPIIGHLHLFKKPLHRTLARLADRYGPVLVLRFGSRPVLVVSSAALAEECFTKNDITFANRPQFPTTKPLSYNSNTFPSLSYGPHWRNMRRIATMQVLSSHRLNSYTEARAEEVRDTVRCLYLESNGEGMTRVELKPRLFGLALNVLTTMVAGKKYYNGTVESSEEARRFLEMVEESFTVLGASNLGDFVPVLRWVDVLGTDKKIVRLQKTRDHLLQGLIDEHNNNNNPIGEESKRSLIGNLLSLQKADPDTYTDHIIKGLVITLLEAGTDTSTNTIEWAMALLLNNQEILEKARVEIDEHVEEGRLLKESDISNLPYLQCIINETFRLYPAGPLLVPHESSQECVVEGYIVPCGTMLLVNAYAINRSPRRWAEPNKFMPERFEEGEGGRTMTFGMGRRGCPGEDLAVRLVGLVLGTLIQCFEWERVGLNDVDMSEGSGLGLPMAIPLEALYKCRHTMINVLSDL